MIEKNKVEKGTLYIVATPIGNLSDFSPRAVSVLEQVDFIAAEDTRVSVKLLNHFGIKKPLISYFEHNKQLKGDYICDRLLNGESCALVSDAGMPAVSDPGELLVMQCAEKGIKTIAIPGASAFVCALAVSGLSTGRFCFEGFLSMNKRNRRQHLKEIENERRTMLFYEAPHKLLSSLKDFLEALGDRKISIVREISKIHEEVFRTSLENAVQFYSQNTPKGEFVLVIEGKNTIDEDESYTLEDAIKIAKDNMQNGMSQSEAAKSAAAFTKIKKNEIYRAMNS